MTEVQYLQEMQARTKKYMEMVNDDEEYRETVQELLHAFKYNHGERRSAAHYRLSRILKTISSTEKREFFASLGFRVLLQQYLSMLPEEAFQDPIQFDESIDQERAASDYLLTYLQDFGVNEFMHCYVSEEFLPHPRGLKEMTHGLDFYTARVPDGLIRMRSPRVCKCFLKKAGQAFRTEFMERRLASRLAMKIVNDGKDDATIIAFLKLFDKLDVEHCRSFKSETYKSLKETPLIDVAFNHSRLKVVLYLLEHHVLLPTVTTGHPLMRLVHACVDDDVDPKCPDMVRIIDALLDRGYCFSALPVTEKTFQIEEKSKDMVCKAFCSVLAIAFAAEQKRMVAHVSGMAKAHVTQLSERYPKQPLLYSVIDCAYDELTKNEDGGVHVSRSVAIEPESIDCVGQIRVSSSSMSQYLELLNTITINRDHVPSLIGLTVVPNNTHHMYEDICPGLKTVRMEFRLRAFLDAIGYFQYQKQENVPFFEGSATFQYTASDAETHRARMLLAAIRQSGALGKDDDYKDVPHTDPVQYLSVIYLDQEDGQEDSAKSAYEVVPHIVFKELNVFASLNPNDYVPVSAERSTDAPEQTAVADQANRQNIYAPMLTLNMSYFSRDVYDFMVKRSNEHKKRRKEEQFLEGKADYFRPESPESEEQ
jgi:hypothetical protein